jgi:hypothetical protein
MKKLFPKSEQFITTILIGAETKQINRNILNGIDEVHRVLSDKPLSKWDNNLFFELLNDVISITNEHDTVNQYKRNVIEKFTIWFPIVPYINTYDFCGILAIIKIMLDNPDLNIIENPQQFISDALNKIAPAFYEIEPEESEYSLYPHKKYIPNNFSYEIVMNDFIIKEFIENKKREESTNEIIEIVLTQPDYFLMLNDHFKNHCYENAFDENLFPLLPESIKANDNQVKILLKKNGKLLSLLSDEQKNNEELVETAINNRPTAIQYASEQIKNNTDIFKVVLSKNGRALEFASAQISDNNELALIAMRQNFRSIDFLSARLKEDLAFMKLCVLIKPEVFKYLPDNLRNVSELILLAASNNKDTYKSVDRNLFIDNNELCEAILKSNGEALKIMPENVKSNRNLVKIAIQENPYFVKYASDDILADLEFMTYVAKINPCIYLFCKANLKNNDAFSYGNMFANPLIYEYLPVHLKNNPRFFDLYINANITSKLWKEFCAIDTVDFVNEINEQNDYPGGNDDLPF